MAAQACKPRLRVAAVIPQADGLLLVRHGKGPLSYHLLPGGGVEAGETLADALVREVLEETGVTCVPVAPLFISDSIDPSGGRHMVQIAFLANPVSAETDHVSGDARVSGTDVVPLDRLTSLDLRPPMAAALQSAGASDFRVPAQYLGAMWVDDNDASQVGGSPAADG